VSSTIIVVDCPSWHLFEFRSMFVWFSSDICLIFVQCLFDFHSTSIWLSYNVYLTFVQRLFDFHSMVVRVQSDIHSTFVWFPCNLRSTSIWPSSDVRSTFVQCSLVRFWLSKILSIQPLPSTNICPLMSVRPFVRHRSSSSMHRIFQTVNCVKTS